MKKYVNFALVSYQLDGDPSGCPVWVTHYSNVFESVHRCPGGISMRTVCGSSVLKYSSSSTAVPSSSRTTRTLAASSTPSRAFPAETQPQPPVRHCEPRLPCRNTATGQTLRAAPSLPKHSHRSDTASRAFPAETQPQPPHSGSASQFRANLFVELFLFVKTYSRRLN